MTKLLLPGAIFGTEVLYDVLIDIRRGALKTHPFMGKKLKGYRLSNNLVPCIYTMYVKAHCDGNSTTTLCLLFSTLICKYIFLVKIKYKNIVVIIKQSTKYSEVA